MNIFLLPYTWLRHFGMALWCASAGLMAWWLVLTALVVLNLDWPPNWDGPILMTSISVTVAVASIAGEANLRRLPLWNRGLKVPHEARGTGDEHPHGYSSRPVTGADAPRLPSSSSASTTML